MPPRYPERRGHGARHGQIFVGAIVPHREEVVLRRPRAAERRADAVRNDHRRHRQQRGRGLRAGHHPPRPVHSPVDPALRHRALQPSSLLQRTVEVDEVIHVHHAAPWHGHPRHVPVKPHPHGLGITVPQPGHPLPLRAQRIAGAPRLQHGHGVVGEGGAIGLHRFARHTTQTSQ